VAIALGNWGDPAAIAALRSVLKDPEPLIRGHASWALSQIGTYPALQAIQESLTQEDDAWVRTELERALEHLASGGREMDRG
jgi:epoxyqueuosine reductase